MPRRAVAGVALAITALVALWVSTSSGFAQGSGEIPESALEFAYFYKNPNMQFVERMLDKLDSPPLSTNRDNRPPAVGFLAGLMTAHPEYTDRIATYREYGQSGLFIVLPALSLAGQQERALAIAENVGLPEKAIATLRRARPSLDAINIGNPDDLDILWGAFSATGNVAYVEKIAAFAERMVEEGTSVGHVLDQSIWTINGRKGAPPAELRDLGQRDRTAAIRLVMTSTAVWALASNAQQHESIAERVVGPDRSNPGQQRSLLRQWAHFYAVNPERVVRKEGDDIGVMVATSRAEGDFASSVDQLDELLQKHAREVRRGSGLDVVVLLLNRHQCRGLYKILVEGPKGPVVDTGFIPLLGAGKEVESSLLLKQVRLNAEQIDVAGAYRYSMQFSDCDAGLPPVSNGFFIY